MHGENFYDHYWKYKYCQIIFSLEYNRSIICQIIHVYGNGIMIEVIDPKDYSASYKKGERVYIERYPGIQIKFIPDNKLKEYIHE